ncbi:MAG: hypothetical protein ACLQMF_20305 [Rectinemataceae bacterium]
MRKILPWVAAALLVLGAAFGFGYFAGHRAGSDSGSKSLAAAAAKFDGDLAKLRGDLAAAQEQSAESKADSERASSEFAVYRSGVERRDSERRAELEHILGAVSGSAGSLNELGTGFDADLGLVDRCLSYVRLLEDGLRRLQTQGGG